MATVTIDGKEYDTDSLSKEAKEQVASLKFVQGEIQRLQAQIAVCQTAASAYSNALKNLID
tara:strand:+ start:187 stop:369 length:183 start_codon:yes stop_codon:yes gene_type:complete